MNILLVRTSALGDIVHALPVLIALRRALPNARIGWVVEQVFAPVLAGHPDLDLVVPVRLRAWRRTLGARATRRELRTALRALRAFRADVALDLMGNHKGALLARLSGARRVIGAARRDRREPESALWLRETVPTPSVHAVDRMLDLLAAVGVAAPTPVDFAGDRLMMPDSAALADAGAEDAALARLLADDAPPFVLLQVGAGWGNKIYPPARWGAVARVLRAQTGHEVWVPVAPGERHLADAAAEASDGAARCVDAGPFPVFAALVRRSRLLIGGDTGPLHLAHALGTPVVCVLGPTDPARNGPYRQPERCVYLRLPCSFCHRRMDDARPCLLDLPARAVVARAVAVLETLSAPSFAAFDAFR
ncbi:MAG: glycosyltransferase family 9 protein [Acidobacteriota bacterium]